MSHHDNKDFARALQDARARTEYAGRGGVVRAATALGWHPGNLRGAEGARHISQQRLEDIARLYGMRWVLLPHEAVQHMEAWRHTAEDLDVLRWLRRLGFDYAAADGHMQECAGNVLVGLGGGR